MIRTNCEGFFLPKIWNNEEKTGAFVPLSVTILHFIMEPDNYIPAIHNWCDRWCERCVFISRCAVGAVELKRWQRDNPMTDEEIWEEVSDNFKEALRMLDGMLREAGLDPEEIANQPPPEPDPDIEALEKEIWEQGMHYFKTVDAFFKNNKEFFEEKGVEIQRLTEMELPIDFDELNSVKDALEIIQQYAAFIGVKARRAISGMEDMHDTEIWGDPPHQNDANGSAKIAVITIERSLGAWEILRKQWPEKSDEILDMLVQLSKLRQRLEQLFPDWHKFVRPGFDTEPPQVRRFEMN